MHTQLQIPWWAERLLLPIVFTVVGAGLGFVLSRWNATLDARGAKKAFLAAIRLELSGLQKQLEASSDELQGSRSRFQNNQGSPPHIIGTTRNTVFSSQLGKLKDLADPLLMEIIELYSDLGVLEKGIEALNNCSQEYSDANVVRQPEIRVQILSVCQALDVKLTEFLRRIRTLESKLSSS